MRLDERLKLGLAENDQRTLPFEAYLVNSFLVQRKESAKKNAERFPYIEKF
jgi:hypothetical protein